jgi:hypothetical protein
MGIEKGRVEGVQCWAQKSTRQGLPKNIQDSNGWLPRLAAQSSRKLTSNHRITWHNDPENHELYCFELDKTTANHINTTCDA